MAYYAPFYRPTYYDQMQNNPNLNQFPQQFQPVAPQNTVNSPQTNNGLIWVQGESAAKSYLVAPGNTVMLMDAENSVFYLKSADISGMPLPLRIFDYKERQNTPVNDLKATVSDFSGLDDRFITREEFELRMASIGSGCKCKEKEKTTLLEDGKNAEPFV